MGRWKALLIAAMVVTNMVAVATTLGGEEDFELVDAYWEAVPAPGAPNTLAVILEYRSAERAESIQATLKLFDVAGQDLASEDSYSGSLTGGMQLTLEFDFTIPEGTKASYCDALLVIEYSRAGTSAEQEISFQVGLMGTPAFSIKASKSRLTRGKTNKVVISIEARSAPARRVEVETTAASAFVTVLGGSLKYEGLVEVGEVLEVPVSLVVDSGAGDSVAIRVSVSYADFSGARSVYSQILGFAVSSRPLPRLVASMRPTRVPSGRSVSVTVTVANKGGERAREVHAALSPSSPGVAVLKGSSAFLGDIPPGGSGAFTALVKAERGFTGTATLTLTLTYRDESGENHLTAVSLGLEVPRGGVPLLLVTVENSTLPYRKPVTVLVKVTNAGDEEAEDVVLDFVSGQSFVILSKSRYVVGELESGESKVVALEGFANGPLGESAVLTVRMKYADPYGEEYADVVNIGFRVEEPGKPVLVLRSLNETLRPNGVNYVLLELANVGSSQALNISVSFASQSMEVASIVGSTTHYVAVLEANSTLRLPYRVFVQPRVYGAIQLIASIYYEDEWGNRYRRLLGIGFEVEGCWELSVVQVSTYPPVLFPGDRAVKLVVTVANTGDYMARDLEIELLEGDWIKPSTASASRALIPYLPVGQTATLVFLVNVDERTPPGNHELALESNGKISRFQLTILEKARFAVYNVSNIVVSPGDRGRKLVLCVENLSNATAEEVRVDLRSPFVVGTTSAQVGRVQPGERALVTFEVDFDETTPLGSLPLEVKVSWSQDNRPLYQFSRIYITAVERKSLWELYGPWLALALAAAIGLVLARKKLSALVKRSPRSAAGTGERTSGKREGAEVRDR